MRMGILFEILKIQSHYRISKQSSNARRLSHQTSVSDPNEAQLRTHARELIEMIRNQTGLSYDCAQETIHSVLSYVSSNFSRLDRNIPALMCELELSSSELLKEPGEVSTSSDSKGKHFDLAIFLARSFNNLSLIAKISIM